MVCSWTCFLLIVFFMLKIFQYALYSELFITVKQGIISCIKNYINTILDSMMCYAVPERKPMKHTVSQSFI